MLKIVPSCWEMFSKWLFNVRFQVFTVSDIQYSGFVWVVVPCYSRKNYWCFGQTYWLHLQCRSDHHSKHQKRFPVLYSVRFQNRRPIFICKITNLKAKTNLAPNKGCIDEVSSQNKRFWFCFYFPWVVYFLFNCPICFPVLYNYYISGESLPLKVRYFADIALYS